MTLSLRSPSRLLLIAGAIAGLILDRATGGAAGAAMGAASPGLRAALPGGGRGAADRAGHAPRCAARWVDGGEADWLSGTVDRQGVGDDLAGRFRVNLPWRWDTGWFTGIAIDGYTWDPNPANEQSIVFFPAFPLLMRLGATLLLMPHAVAVVWSGVVIAWITFALACVYIYRLTREEFGDDAGLTAVMLLAAYPFAVFFSTAYSESLFLFTIVATFYHFRRRELLPAAIFGLVAGLSRLNGCMLSVVLAAVIVLREWLHRDAAADGIGAAVAVAVLHASRRCRGSVHTRRPTRPAGGVDAGPWHADLRRVHLEAHRRSAPRG